MTYRLSTPIQGWAAPLEEVDDPVFKEGMAGDGVVIDPTGSIVFAPCDAKIVSIPSTRHAVALQTCDGIEILIHIGLETAILGGEGFIAHVTAGDAVRAGDQLISFDMDWVGRRARSLQTPILVTNLDEFQIAWRLGGQATDVGDRLLQVTGTQRFSPSALLGEVQTRSLNLALKPGLHARPAARLAALIRPYDAEIRLEVRDRSASAKNLISLMTLQAITGDDVRLTGSGPDAAEALDRVAAFLVAKENVGPSAPLARQEPGLLSSQTVQGSRVICGVRAAPGQAIGRAVQLIRHVPVETQPPQGPVVEAAALERALAHVRCDLIGLVASGGSGGDIMAAHLGLLDDPDLRSSADQLVLEGHSAASAWSQASTVQARRLEVLENPYLRARAADVVDLERRVLRQLGGEASKAAAWAFGSDAILLADDVSPSELLGLKGMIVGVCTAGGGSTSHLAIIASALNLPAVVAAGDQVLAVANGTRLLVDGDKGELILEPTATEGVRTQAVRRGLLVADDLQVASGLSQTLDGVRIEVLANLAGAEGASEAISLGAEGCGLLRTEFLFMDRAEPPGEEEQRLAYQAMADALGGRPLTIRTFDFGGDKPLRFLKAAKEDNPALGLRGVRTSLRRPDLLRPQLRAILKVRPKAVCRILLPMVTAVDEVLAIATILEEERRALGLLGGPELGVMIETPAAALAAAAFGAHARFFSIGSNDLAQYTLATDRSHAVLAKTVDALHPAVLRLMALACEGALQAGRPIGVCGALASNALAAPLLVGLGVSNLSASPAAVPAVKAAIGSHSIKACRALAEEALSLTTLEEVHALIAKAAAGAGFGNARPETNR